MHDVLGVGELEAAASVLGDFQRSLQGQRAACFPKRRRDVARHKLGHDEGLASLP